MGAMSKTIRLDGSFKAWRDHARALLAADTSPEAVRFVDISAAPDPLFASASPSVHPDPPPPPAACGVAPPRVPKRFLTLAETVALHRQPDRWALMYRVLYRLTHGEPYLLDLAGDPDVRDLNLRHHAVRRDAHKMHAFVRFRLVPERAGPSPGRSDPDPRAGPSSGRSDLEDRAGDGPARDSDAENRAADGPAGTEAGRYVAFHRPDHLIVRREAGWFKSRFPNLPFSLLTPDLSAHWDPVTKKMSFTPGVSADAAAAPDDVEALWLAYYRSTFNPARIKLDAMVKEMPRRHWPTLPETALIPQLLAEAPARLELMEQYAMAPKDSAAPFVPDSTDLDVLAEAATHCKGCPLYEPATQVVFGAGTAAARLMLVGEQPGDNEDREGQPFIGPAGQKLDDLLQRAGIDRETVYVTNAVKHFKFELRGKFRLHKKPGVREVNACVPWLEAEVAAVKPRVVVALGATAARALFGATFKITKQRGEVMSTRWAPNCLATYHPSALLRAPDPDMAAAMEEALYSDLAMAARLLDEPEDDAAGATPGTLF